MISLEHKLPVPKTQEKGIPLSKNVKLVWDSAVEKYMVIRSDSDWNYLNEWETSLFMVGYSQGCDHGNKDGYEDGYEKGYNKGYNDGCEQTRGTLL